MTEDFHKFKDANDTAPAYDLKIVTPDDNNDLPDGPCQALYVGSTGDLYVDMVGGATNVPIIGVLGGAIYPYRVRRVRSTNTTAGSILAIY